MIQSDRSRQAHLRTLQAGADAGFYVLPDRVVQAIRVDKAIRDGLQDAIARQRKVVGPDGVAAAMAEAVVVAARTGKPLPDVASEVEAAESAERRAAVEVRVWTFAQEEASRELLVSVRPDQFIAESLQPAYAELLGRLPDLAARLLPYRVKDAERMVSAPKEARDAYAALVAAADRYDALRAAHAAAQALGGGPREDTRGDFGWLKHPERLLRGLWFHRAQMGHRVEVPEHRLERMLWFVGDGAAAEPWMPTIAEQDARAKEQAEADRKSNAARLRPAGAMGF